MGPWLGLLNVYAIAILHNFNSFAKKSCDLKGLTSYTAFWFLHKISTVSTAYGCGLNNKVHLEFLSKKTKLRLH